MTIWKLGCNWGKGKPSFYDFIKNEKIIIGVESQLYSKNDLAIITEGYTVKAIVKVITDPIPSVTNINLKAPFEEYKINFEPWLSGVPLLSSTKKIAKPKQPIFIQLNFQKHKNKLLCPSGAPQILFDLTSLSPLNL